MKGREGGGGGEGVREEVTLQQHLDTTKGSWRMAPGVSAENRRTRRGAAVSPNSSVTAAGRPGLAAAKLLTR